MTTPEMPKIRRFSIKHFELLYAFREHKATAVIVPDFSYYQYNSKPGYNELDLVNINWKSRNPFDTYCAICGEPNIFCTHNKGTFTKLLGTVEITKTTKLIGWVGNDAPIFDGFSLNDLRELGKKCGFEDFKLFQKYILERFYIGSQRVFWMYEFRWLEMKTDEAKQS